MFSKIPITKFTESCSARIERLKNSAETADCIIIGAGAGLSASAGFVYDGERFKRYFSDFEAKYGFHDMYSGGFYPYRTLEEYWAYWSRNIYANRYTDAPKPVYGQLLQLVRDKEYFVITTNVDHCFQKAGFDKQRLFYTQGDYGLFQCSVPCDASTYDNKEAVLRMVAEQKDMKIPAELIPKCPKCGKPLTMNLRCDDGFVEDEGRLKAARRCKSFLRAGQNRRILFLELGVGFNTPAIIKYPFWQMTAQNKMATYICINKGEAFCPREIEDRAVCIDGDIGEAVAKCF